MPRKSRTSTQPVRTSAPKREAHSVATPAAPPPQVVVMQPPVASGGGMLSQIASVAVGSAIGHTVGRALTGAASSLFSSDTEGPAQASFSDSSSARGAGPVLGCDADSRAFLDCMTKNNHEVSSCQFYLDMLKACQENAKYQ